MIDCYVFEWVYHGDKFLGVTKDVASTSRTEFTGTDIKLQQLLFWDLLNLFRDVLRFCAAYYFLEEKDGIDFIYMDIFTFFLIQWYLFRDWSYSLAILLTL
jgi:hypothetical protein